MANLARVDEVVAALIRRDEQASELADAFVKRDGQIYINSINLGRFLGYADATAFSACVHRAQVTASQTGRSVQENFVSPHLFDPQGDGVWLTPWAAFASIIEADNRKPKVAVAKSFFASLADREISNGEARLKERALFKRNHKELHGAAEKVGVTTGEDHAIFDNEGYMGMYGMGIRQVEQYKKVPNGQKLIDCAGNTEIAANNLRMAMTKDTLDSGQVKGKAEANRAHRKAGNVVRDAVVKGTGMSPIHLPLADKTLDELSLEKKRELKDAMKAS